jgi:hypothetical protein
VDIMMATAAPATKLRARRAGTITAQGTTTRGRRKHGSRSKNQGITEDKGRGAVKRYRKRRGGYKKERG